METRVAEGKGYYYVARFTDAHGNTMDKTQNSQISQILNHESL